MKKLNPIHGALAILAVALAPLAAAQTANSPAGSDEAGTIPAARPGLPAMPDERGAQGPIRAQPRPTADPSIRPFLGGPDVRNGLYETVAGNRVVSPGSQEGSGTFQPQGQ